MKILKMMGFALLPFGLRMTHRDIALCRDELECPNSIYIEYTDQI